MNLKTSIALSALALTLALPVQAGQAYRFDKAHTNVLFFIDHLGFSEMLGRFHDYDGEIVLDSENWSRSSVTVRIDTASVDMFHDGLNEHLRNADFFDVERFPTMDFRSTAVELDADGKGRLHGELTLLGVTRPVSLELRLNKYAKHPMFPVQVAGFSAHGQIQRSDFGMNYLVPAVGDTVTIRIETELHRIETSSD